MTGSVIDAARLPHMAVRQRSLDDLVAEQCEDPTAQEEWARIAVPVHARGSAPVIRRSFRLRGEISYFFQAQHIIAQEQDGRRSVDQMPVAGTTAPADREAEQSGVRLLRFVKEAVAAQLTLRCAFPRVAAHYGGLLSEPHAREMQIILISSDDYRAGTHRFDPIHSMLQRKLGGSAARPWRHIQARPLRILRRSPTAAGAIQQVIADETVLESVPFRLRQLRVVGGLSRLAAVREIRQRH